MTLSTAILIISRSRLRLRLRRKKLIEVKVKVEEKKKDARLRQTRKRREFLQASHNISFNLNLFFLIFCFLIPFGPLLTITFQKSAKKTNFSFIPEIFTTSTAPSLIGWGCHPLFGEMYFKDTDHQLEVIRIKGKEPGLTVLIFGGIHGDEPGGYFSSEILSQIKLMKGNLIIVPRVNFPSIMLNRREVHGDMNRKFGSKEKPDDPDAEVVKHLKQLMKEADVFINQHDAYGFHRETYFSKKYNQHCYGQSLIIDCSDFCSKKLKKQINLGDIGQRILERVNQQIKIKKHHFGFWDHNSLDPNTKFPEMKQSATYYALTAHSIPAFGLETSKDLPDLYHKVKYQLLAIKEILHEFGLEFIYPAPKINLPVLYWVEFLKNDKEILRINGNTNFRLNPGDRIVIKEIFSNYNSGLSANILNWGNINDMNKEFVFEKPTNIQVKKNHLTMGKIYLRNYGKNSVRQIVLDVNGDKKTIPNWGKIEVQKGHYFKILDTSPNFSQIRFDVRGFNLPPGQQDDSQVKIFPENLIKKYSFKKEGNIFFVKIYNANRFAGEFQVEIK